MNDKNCRRCKHFNPEVDSNYIMTMQCPHKQYSYHLNKSKTGMGEKVLGSGRTIRFRWNQAEDMFEILVKECDFFEDLGVTSSKYYKEFKPHPSIVRQIQQQSELDLLKEQLRQQQELINKLLQDRGASNEEK